MNWRTVTPSNSPKFLVKGTELNVTLYGQQSRYQICEIRSYDADGFADRNYLLRDAHTVTDAQVRDGVRPAIVGRFDTLEEIETFCALDG